MSSTTVDVASLFDRKAGTLKAGIYSDPAVYDLEMERIFARSWLLLGHEAQIPRFGDFVLATMGEDSVIVSRQGDGSVIAFLNQCRHRGNRLCLAETGNSKSFRCTYHGWVFNNAGNLVAVPHEQDGYRSELNKAEWSAIRVPRLAIYKGLIFGNWDKDAPDLISALGDVAWYLDGFIDRREGGIELLGPQRHSTNANWKWQAEQHATDMFHAAVSHTSAFKALVPPGAPPASFDYLFHPEEKGHQFGMAEQGHGASGWMLDMNDSDIALTLQFPPPPACDYLAGEARSLMRERLGPTRTDQMGSLVMTVFPNLSLNRAAHYLRTWQPRGPNRTEVWSYAVVDRDAPQDVKDAIARGMTYSFAASGIVEQDDSENVAMCQKGSSEGFMSRRTRFNVQMGLGHAGPHPDFPGTINNVYAEEGARAFYSHWQDMLAGAAT